MLEKTQAIHDFDQLRIFIYQLMDSLTQIKLLHQGILSYPACSLAMLTRFLPASLAS